VAGGRVIPTASLGTDAAFSGVMTSKILAFLVLSANLAVADESPQAPERAPESAPASAIDSAPTSAPETSIDVAIANEREAGTRERYYAQLTTIAERDIVTAQITGEMALRQWDRAVQAGRDGDVRRWSKRHEMALRDEREARARAASSARERDQARADFRVAAAEVRRLDRRASR
jgi:hypothetical protein